MLGKSGSGKSTLLNAIGGLDKFDGGEIIIKGKSSADFSQADFDSYRNTQGRHEGIDFTYGIGKNVYSLTDGVVTRVTMGKEGSTLSTIAIYNQSYNKTIVYLHSAPLTSLYEGQQITKGQLIATESWRGISSKSSAHTHVEVRNGKKTAASVSVGDSTLDNENPNSFWNQVGYEVK